MAAATRSQPVPPADWAACPPEGRSGPASRCWRSRRALTTARREGASGFAPPCDVGGTGWPRGAKAARRSRREPAAPYLPVFRVPSGFMISSLKWRQKSSSTSSSSQSSYEDMRTPRARVSLPGRGAAPARASGRRRPRRSRPSLRSGTPRTRRLPRRPRGRSSCASRPTPWHPTRPRRGPARREDRPAPRLETTSIPRGPRSRAPPEDPRASVLGRLPRHAFARTRAGHGRRLGLRRRRGGRHRPNSRACLSRSARQRAE